MRWHCRVCNHATLPTSHARPDPEEMNRGNEDVGCELMIDSWLVLRGVDSGLGSRVRFGDNVGGFHIAERAYQSKKPLLMLVLRIITEARGGCPCAMPRLDVKVYVGSSKFQVLNFCTGAKCFVECQSGGDRWP